MNVILICTLVSVVVIQGVDMELNANAPTLVEEDDASALVGNKTTEKYIYNFVDTNGTTLVLMMLRKYPAKLNLQKKVMKKDDDKASWLDLGSDSLDSAPASVTAVMDTADNSTRKTITATLVFTDLGPNPNSTFSITDATLVLIFQMGGAGTKSGYWNMSQASIDVKYLNSSDSVPTKLHTDITPAKFGYSNNTADAACTTGYGVCAPRGLLWSCGVQKLSPNILNAANNSISTFVSLPGLALFPFPDNHSLTYPGSVYNWDCDPLIPISVWTSLLVSLGLAAVVVWGCAMLSYLPTPDRWDDPKKPGIYVRQED